MSRAEPAPRRPVVLVVDDHPAIRGVAERALAEDYRVLSAASGAAAVTLIETLAEPVDLLITDLGLPDIRGGDLAARLRASDPRMRVLFISGSAEQLDSARLPAPLLGKPFYPSILRAKVRELIGPAD